MSDGGDFIFNCQMGRGRTTTGMISACLVSSTSSWNSNVDPAAADDEISDVTVYDTMDGPSEEEVYLAGKLHNSRVAVIMLNALCSTGEYKTILQLVGVLSHGKIAKRLTDRAIDLMQDVQNLRKAIYE
jgi:hypothetical protein